MYIDLIVDTTTARYGHEDAGMYMEDVLKKMDLAKAADTAYGFAWGKALCDLVNAGFSRKAAIAALKDVQREAAGKEARV